MLLFPSDGHNSAIQLRSECVSICGCIIVVICDYFNGPFRWCLCRIPLHMPSQSIEYLNTPIKESQETKIHYCVYDSTPYQQWYHSPFYPMFHMILWWRWPESNRRLNCYPYVSTVSLLFSSYNSLAFHIMWSHSSVFSINNWASSFYTATIITTCGTFIPVRSSYAEA